MLPLPFDLVHGRAFLAPNVNLQAGLPRTGWNCNTGDLRAMQFLTRANHSSNLSLPVVYAVINIYLELPLAAPLPVQCTRFL